ncbi:hypothetical protein BGZ65_003167 [Modicella reniformis]|uniref:BHLH domain-containing protein n=1 Tax=Modicella reniformis TaxID=1440133 RepID=A0A9P6SV89_9FUNG|nr:hypothetical protein BGZ65_003167 [Modicella reniformis]
MFLGQLAQEERHKTLASSAGEDPILSQQSFQHQMYNAQHRQPLPQLPLPSSLPSVNNGDFSRSLPSINDPSVVVMHQQRDLIQQINSNSILAPGGIIDPHVMSQAFLQNPELMVQANAITQAMVLAQQQQMQQQMRDQQQTTPGIHHQDSYPMHGSPSPHQHPYHQGSPPGQYPAEQQHYYNHGTGDRPIAKPRSPTKLQGGDLDGGSVHHSGVDSSYSSSPNGYFEAGHFQEHEDEYAGSKLATGRKGYASNDPSPPSSLTGRSGYRPELQRHTIRRKKSGTTPYDKNNRRSDGHTDNEEASFPGPGAEHRNGSTKNGFSSQMGESESSRNNRSSDNQMSRTRSPTSQMQPRSSKKAPHELLTESEKKANHIASEQKRRQNIRIGFDSLVEIVPTLSECHRSEALILQKSVDYIQRLLSQKYELKNRVRVLQANLGEPQEDDDDSASDMELEIRH